MFSLAVTTVALYAFYMLGGLPWLLGFIIGLPLRLMDLFNKIFRK
jgi:hypothetical protein